MRAWQLAQAGLARCAVIASRMRQRSCPARRLRSSAPGCWAAAAAAPTRAGSRAPTCRAAPARCGWRTSVIVRMLPWPSSPPRGLPSGSVDAAEVAAAHVRDAVVLRQPLVEERVVRRQQVEHAAVLAEDAVDEELGLALPSPRAASRRNPGTAPRRAASPRCRADTATAPRSSSPATRDRGSASMRRTCCSSDCRILQPARDRRVEQLVVRDAAPQEERQPRRELEIADAVGDAGRQRSPGRRSMRNRNCELTSSRSSAR